ncbi:sigma-54-dependent transcriptional regulator [Methylibium rhizosphaerae]|uniref:sigma-54-dependent transcriptional regulator n=1 Tax=Methylibium rhizosphaerae TaxID=2570323 RepID=UPI001129B16C|nr:sigma-54 dependent transcriptional regulator [Methylibium rhizosphaerae]
MSTPAHFSLLVVDDEPDLRTLYELTLLREGYDVETAGTVEDAWLHLKDRTYSAVITDMRLPDGTGLDLLHRLEEAGRREKAVVITAYGSAENAVEALKAGAYDYLTKPVDLKQFRTVVASALGRVMSPGPTVQPANLPSENAAAPASAATAKAARLPVAAPPPAPIAAAPSGSPALNRMAGSSQAMQHVRSLVEKVARSMAPVLVHGESGTGKELVARAIHEVSARAAQPFIAVNCGAIPEQLLEAEFFGYRKGAFTGAAEDREGFFQAARGGTLFLDEIGDLPLSMQSKLLRSIQERAVRPVGAVSEVPVDVRIVSATHKDLAAEVQNGRFRQDLYYRLNVIQIRTPPLRERLEDLMAICDRVLTRIASDAGVSPPPQLSRDALMHLMRYPFPGNVRELENLLHRAVALSGGEIITVADLGLPDASFGDSGPQDFDTLLTQPAALEPLHLPPPPDSPPPPPARRASDALPSDLAAYLDGVERDILVRALERHRFNRTAAGASLGLSLRQMRYRMARLGIQVADQGLTIGEPSEPGDAPDPA